MKRNYPLYIRFLLIVGLFIAGAAFTADLVNYTYFPSEDALDFVFIFGGEPTQYATQALDYGRYYEITLPGTLKDVDINRFLGYSPVVGFRASSGKGTITLRFDMLLPREPEIVVVANTLRVTFHRTTVSWDEVSVYSDTTLSGNRPPLTSLLARLQKYLDVNLVIDEASIRGLQAEFVMLSDSLKAEDYFFQIVMNNPTLGYAFLPNNTVYVVRKELISAKVEEILRETTLSPRADTNYWSSYAFRIKKDSFLFSRFSRIDTYRTAELEGSATSTVSEERIFEIDQFYRFIIEEFGTKYAKVSNSIQNDLIVGLQGKETSKEIAIGVLLYGDNTLHEKFQYFLSFLEGETTTEIDIKAEFSQNVKYSPLLPEEVRAFIDFYTKYNYTANRLLNQETVSNTAAETSILLEEKKNLMRTIKGILGEYAEGVDVVLRAEEKTPDTSEISFEINETESLIYLYGPEENIKKFAQYLNDYIKDRKARGNEKLERFEVKDGAGNTFALALSRTFPKAIVNSGSVNFQMLASKPTFLWTEEDMKKMISYDGQPDEVTILGSNYEVTTAKRIADDWGLLVPPLESEIRMVVLSENLPDNARAALLNPESPNSLVVKFPSVQIDPSFEPLIIVRGKPQDLDTIAGYLAELEQVWFKKPEYVEVINVSQELMAKEAEKYMTTTVNITESEGSGSSYIRASDATPTQASFTAQSTDTASSGKTSYIELGQVNVVASNLLAGDGDTATYIKTRWPSIKVSVVYQLNLFILRGENKKDISEALEELERLDWEASNEKLYSELTWFKYLKSENIRLIWEQFYKKWNVNIIYIQSINAYKFYGPEKYVKALVTELQEIDVDRIAGQPIVQTELVRINITSLTQEEVEKLVSIKIPGVVIERFDVAGYFVTGTQEQINKTKDFLNTLTSDFIEDSSILQLARGVSFETVVKVLALYFSEKDLQVLDLTDPSGSNTPRFLIKGQKERTDNAKLILRSFEMIENTDGAEPPYVHTLDFRKISENTQKEWSTDDILQILYTSYPGVKVNFLPSTQTFLFVGRKSDILAAVSEIESLPQKPSVSRIFTFSNSKHPFQNPQTGEKYTVEELQILLKERYPEVKFTLLEDGSRFSTLELYGKESAVTSCFALLTNVYPPVIINEDKKTFNLQATGQETQEITDIIAKNLQPRVNVYIPQNSPVSDYPSYNYSTETVKSTQTCSFHLENLRWDDWLNILRRVYNYKIDTYSTNGQTLTILIPPGMAYETGSEEIRVLRADYGYEEALNLIQSPIFGGKGYMDKEKGFVVFSGISDIKMEQFMNHLFEVVRQTPPMVEIKVLIVDDNLLGDFQTGANITLSASPLLSLSTDGGLNFNASLLDMANTTKILESITRNLQFNLSLKGKDSDEDSFLKTAPYLSTLSGKTATIRIGESVNFIKETLVGTLTESQTVTFNPGYNLSITPSVRSDETILLKVNINISNQTVNLISNADYSENSRNVQTEVILLNGETLIIGGLEGTGSTTSMTKVPFLGDLPFLGQFFRKEGKNEVTRSVSLFITPSIKYVEPQKPRITVENINLNAIGYLK